MDGTAVGGANTLKDGLHTGVKLAEDVQRVLAEVEIFNWYADQPGGGRVSGLTFGDGTQSNFIRFVFGDIGGQLGLEVGLEIGDSYTVLGTSLDAAFVAAMTSGGTTANQKKVTLQLEISGIGDDYTIAANFQVNGETDLATVALSDSVIPVGVLRDVLDGTHTISDGDTTLNSGAAIGIVAEKNDGVSFSSVDIDVIRVEGFGNEVIATTEAEAEAPGTDGEDTVIYDGPGEDIALDETVENFDGSAATTDWDLVGTKFDNEITTGEGENVITTGTGEDVVMGDMAALDGDEITDFTEFDKVVISDATAADATNVSYQAGSAIVNVNGTEITFSGPDFEDFAPEDGPSTFAFIEGDEGLEITLVPDEVVLYRVNAAGATIASTDEGPDWESDSTYFNGTGPVTISGTAGSTYTNTLTDSQEEIDYTADVDPNIVPWEVFVNERSDGTNDATELTYNFDVEAGKSYRITLLYTENWINSFSAVDRIFDVAVEGAVPAAFNDIHPLRDATDFVDGVGEEIPFFATGGNDAKQPYLGVATQREFSFTATDDVLSLAFQHGAPSGIQNPKINAIQITQIGSVEPVEDTTPPVVADITVEDSISDQDSPRTVTALVVDETGLNIADFVGLDGSELVFTGLTPGAVAVPQINLSADQKTATLTYVMDPPAGTSSWPVGTFSVAVAAGTFADAAANLSQAASFDFTFAAPLQPGDVVLAVNAGGVAVAGDAYGLPGVTFEADTFGAPNATVDFSESAGGNKANNNGDGETFTGVALPDTVFTSERWGNEFSYNVDVPNGTYEVDLYFAETFQGVQNELGVGARSFDADIEGVKALDDYDLFDDGDGILGNGEGAALVKIVKSYLVEVTDGTMNIVLDAKVDGDEVAVDNAKISAFVIRVPEAIGATAALTGDAIVDEDAGTASYTVTLSEAVTEVTDIVVTIAATTADVPGDAEASGGGTQLTLTFAPEGALSQDFTVDIFDDTLPELDETFIVSISGLPTTFGANGSVSTVVTANDGAVDSVNGIAVTDGDFSDNGLAPTDLGTLSRGDTEIVASQQGDSAPGGRERDYFTFTVAEGDMLTGIMLEGWETLETGFPQAFIGLQAGPVVDVDPETFANAENLLGGYIYGTGDVANVATSFDGNLLTPTALGDGNEQGITFGDGSGFAAPLPAGTYTIWLNQGGDISTASLRLVTEEFVEMVTIAISDSESVAENGDFGTTEVGFDLTASDNYTGVINVVFDTAAAMGQSQDVSFVDGVGRLTFAIDNDTVDNGAEEITITQLLSGSAANGAVVTVSDTGDGAISTVTEDDGVGPTPDKGVLAFAVNAGGPAVTNESGVTYEASDPSEWVFINVYTDPAAQQPAEGDYTGDGVGNADDTVYITDYYGGKGTAADLSFTRTGIPAGDYVLVIKMAETYDPSTATSRIFDVSVNGEVVKADINLIADVGLHVADDFEVKVTIPDEGDGTGTLVVSGDPSADNAKFSALELWEAIPPFDPTVPSVSVEPVEVAETDASATVTFVRTGPTDEPLTITFATNDGTAVAGADFETPASSTVTFGIGETQATVDIGIIDDFDAGSVPSVSFDVEITDATVPSGGPVNLTIATAQVTILDDEYVDPNDIDGDGIENTDDPFAYDGTNGGSKVLTLGNAFRQDFNVDTADPFSAEAGFTGIMVNPALVHAGASETDPYGVQTSEATTIVEDGVFKTQSSANDSFAGSGTNNKNTIRDNYQSAADVTGVDTFVVEAKANNVFATTFGNGIPSKFASYGITMGAGGVDDFLKFVVGGIGDDETNNQLRIEIGNNDSLTGGANTTLASEGIDKATQATIDSVLFQLAVDKNAEGFADGSITGTAIFYDVNDAIIGSITTAPIGISGSFAAAIAGNNPLTGGDGGIAYGLSITHYNNAANQFTGEWDYLTLAATDPVDLSIGAPAAPVAESGDSDTTTLDFVLSAPGFTGTMDLEFTVDGAPQSASGIAFVDGNAVLSIDRPNDDLDDGDTAVVVVLTGSSNASVTVDPLAAEGTVTEDDTAPVAAPFAIFTFEDTAVTFNPAANDTDADTDVANLVVTSVQEVSAAPTEATVALGGDGTVTVTPINGFAGEVTFTYIVSDGTNTATSSAVVTITEAAVVGIQDAPTQVETGDTGAVTLGFPITSQPALAGDVDLAFTVNGVAATQTVTLDAAGVGILSVDVANDDAFTPDETTDLVLTAVTTNGFKLGADALAASGRIIDDDNESTLDILVDEDVPVGDAETPYTLEDDVESIDTSATTQGTNLVGNDNDNLFKVGVGPDVIDLQESGGADTVEGTAEALDGIVIANAEEDDEVVITDGSNAVIANVSEGSTIVTVDLDGDLGDDSDQFDVVYAESNLIPTLEDGVLSVEPTLSFRIQAEEFDSASGYGAQAQASADNGGVAFLPNNGATGSAIYNLDGAVPAGTYTVVVGYYDENDGKSTIGLSITSDGEDEFTAGFEMDEETPSGTVNPLTFRTQAFGGVVIGENGQLELTGTSDLNEGARIDYFDFLVEPDVEDPENTAPYTPFPIEDQTTDENADFSLDVGAAFVDDEENTMTFSSVNDLPEGLTLVDGVLSGAPVVSGDFVISIVANDGFLDSAPMVFDLTINDVNNAPVVAAPVADQFVSVGEAVNIAMADVFTDQDLDTLTYELIGTLPSGLEFNETTGLITGAPDGAAGSTQVTIVASDGLGGTASDSFVFNITGGVPLETIRIEAEDADTLSNFFIANNNSSRIQAVKNAVVSATYNLDDIEAGQYAVRIAYWDEADGESLLGLSVVSGEVTTEVGSFVLDDDDTSGNNANGDSYRITTFNSPADISMGDIIQIDGLADAGEPLRIDYIELVPLSGPNFAPTVTAAGVEDLMISGLVPIDATIANAFSDPEENTLTFGKVSGPDWLEIDTATGAVSGTPAGAGTYTVTVSAEDAEFNSGILATTQFTITVEEPDNLAPVLDFPVAPITVDQDGFVEESVTFTDPENQTLIYSLGEGAPDWLSIDQDGTLTGSPEGIDVADDIVVTVIATDPSQGVGMVDILISVNNVNDAPEVGVALEDQQATLGQDFNYVLPVDAFTDADIPLGDMLTYSAALENGTPLPTWLTIDPITGTLSGVPDVVTDLSVVVTATDLAGLSVSAPAITIDLGSFVVPTDPVQIEAEDFTGISCGRQLCRQQPDCSVWQPDPARAG